MKTSDLRNLNESIIKTIKEFGNDVGDGRLSRKYPHADAYHHGQHLDNEIPRSYEDHLKGTEGNDFDADWNSDKEAEMKHLDDKIKEHHPNWSPKDAFNQAQNARMKAQDRYIKDIKVKGQQNVESPYTLVPDYTDHELSKSGHHSEVIQSKNNLGFPLA